MRIKRANFRFNRLVNVDDIIGHSNLLLMEQEDINVDNNVHDCILEDNANIVEVANDIANRICGLYNTFINDNNTSYAIQ